MTFQSVTVFCPLKLSNSRLLGLLFMNLIAKSKNSKNRIQ